MSNRKIDTMLREFNGEYKSVKVIGKVTYVVLEMKGFTGVGWARCSDRDEFNMETGIEVATRRAIKHIIKQMEELNVQPEQKLSSDTHNSTAVPVFVFSKLARKSY